MFYHLTNQCVFNIGEWILVHPAEQKRWNRAPTHTYMWVAGTNQRRHALYDHQQVHLVITTTPCLIISSQHLNQPWWNHLSIVTLLRSQTLSHIVARRMALLLNFRVFFAGFNVGSMSWLCSDWSVLMTKNRSGANLSEGFPSSLHPSSLLLTVTGGPARRRPHQHTGSSQRVSQNWPHNPSSRRRRRYSWCVIPGRCRSCSSGPSLLRSHGRIIACTGHWVSSGQTCRQCGSLLRCESWNTRWRLSHAMSTASRRAQRGAASIDCRCRQTWGCRWALGAGRPASRRSCWGTADSRTGNIARWWIGGSS